jgi:hypothetical protein
MAEFTQVKYLCIKIDESDVVEIVPCPPGFTLNKEEKQIGHVINVLAKDGWRLLPGQGTITPGDSGWHHLCFLIMVREKSV